MKGDRFAATGNARAAAQFYGAAVTGWRRRCSGPAAGARGLRGAGCAAQSRDQIHAHIEQHLRKGVASAGFDERTSSRRFVQSMEMLAGRVSFLSRSNPAYYFPELPQIQFYPREQFPGLDAIEAARTRSVRSSRACSRNQGLEPTSSRAVTPFGDRHCS